MSSGNKKLISLIVIVIAFIGTYFTYKSMMYAKTDYAIVDAHTKILTSKIPGLVLLIKVREGQSVKKGDVLVELDQTNYQNALTQLKSDVLSQQFEKTKLSNSEIKARTDSLKTRVSQAEIILSNTKIVAPADGFIGKISVKINQMANPGEPLIEFVDSAERWVIAYYTEKDLASIKIGANALVKIVSVNSKDFVGIVESIGSATGVNFSLLPPKYSKGNDKKKVIQTVPVKIKFDALSVEDIQLLRAGLSANVRVHK